MRDITFLFCLIFATQSYLTGNYTDFNIDVNPNFDCRNGQKFEDTIKFSNVFAYQPQIIISRLSYKHDPDVQFRFSIITTTTTEWTFSIECLNTQLYKYEFTWIAIVDNRIMVINDYINTNELISAFQSKLYYFPYSNVYYLVVPQILSYFGGWVNIVAVKNGNQFSILINEGSSGLGIQVIAAQISQFSFFSQAGLYFNVNNQIQKYINDKNYIELLLIYYLEGQNSIIPPLTYREQDFTFESNTINIIGSGWNRFSICVAYYAYSQPYYFRKMRISKKVFLDIEIKLVYFWQQLNLIQFKKNLTNTDSYSLQNVIHKELSFIYEYSCQLNKKVVGKILKQPQVPQSYQNFIQYCYKSINQLKIYLTLYQESPLDSQLDFYLSNLGLTVNQTFASPVITTYTIIVLEIKDQ